VNDINSSLQSILLWYSCTLTDLKYESHTRILLLTPEKGEKPLRHPEKPSLKIY